MDTITNEIRDQLFDFGLLAPTTQAAIGMAQHEAKNMNAPEVYPEHVFLAAVRQDDVEVNEVLKDIGLDPHMMQTQSAETFNNPNNEDIRQDLLFSRELLVCFEWAESFATEMNSSLMFPKHLLLSVLRHPRIQPLLALLLYSREELPAPFMEVEGHAYTSYIDQLIHSRVREQSLTKLKHSALKRVFRRFERPNTTFADIQGLDGAKDKLREVVDFLRKPQNFRQSMKTYLYGLLLVGHPCTDRTLLVKATAGEAVVPLSYLSISALVELLIDLDSHVISLDDLELPMNEYNLLTNNSLSQKGRNLIIQIFSQAKKISPCVLFIDDLDAVDQLPTVLEREQWLKQLVIEMDGLDEHPSMAIIATTNRISQLDEALLHPGRFEHKVTIGSSIMTHPLAQTKLCLACKFEVLASWKYCVYCGAFLARTCPKCGTLFMELEGARFCSECGISQRNT